MAGPNLPPVDLTTLGAVGTLPPKSHPIYDTGAIRSASDFPDLNLTSQELALQMYVLKFQVASLARLLGVTFE